MKKEKCGYGCGRDWNEAGDFDDCPSAYHVAKKKVKENMFGGENAEAQNALMQALKDAKELFNTNELNKDWMENFYESDWTADTLNLTDFEKQIISELTTFLPRHMNVYDWNLPYAEAIILIIRNLLDGKKIINK